MKRIALVTVAVLALMGSASAADWKLIESDANFDTYIDSSTAKHVKGGLQFTLMIDLARPGDGTMWKDIAPTQIMSYVAKCNTMEDLLETAETDLDYNLGKGKIIATKKFRGQKVDHTSEKVFDYIIINACNDEQTFPDRPESK